MRNFEQSGRSLAVSRHGMAATSHPASTLAAVNILQEGGSAIDAAVAACAVQGVVESGSTGIGGDCFVLMSKGGSTDLIAYNGSGRAPAAATLDWFEGQGIAKIEPRSPHAVTIPGSVEAWSRLIADHGKFDLGRVLAPAAKLAREGYAITPRVAYDLGHAVEFLNRNDAARAALLSVDGKGLPVGAVHTQPKLADTLEAIGRNGPAAFYRGRIAEDMVESLRAAGGLQTLDDFAATKGEYVKPISTDFRGRTVYECPPNGQGVIALLIMNILSRFTPKGGPLEIDNLHVEIEATRLAYAARNQLLGDTAREGANTVAYLLSDKLADELAAKIDVRGRALALPTFEEPEHRDTVYITVVDKDRTAVSFINSLFLVYGSAIMSRNTGVLFHDRGMCFHLQRGHPNVIAPGKRPMHTIIPVMVAEQGRVTMSFGVMGGHYQAMGHAYFLSKLYDHGMDMQSAMELPRLFPQLATGTIDLERALLDRHGADLARRGFTVGPSLHPIGGAQAIAIDWKQGVLIGASDPRKDGCALGW